MSAVGGVPCRRWAESVSLLRRVPSATSGDRRSRANATCSTERQREVRRIWRQEAAGTICRLRIRGRLRSSKLDPVLKAHKPLSQSHSRDSATTFASPANSDSSVCVRTLSSPGDSVICPTDPALRLRLRAGLCYSAPTALDFRTVALRCRIWKVVLTQTLKFSS